MTRSTPPAGGHAELSAAAADSSGDGMRRPLPPFVVAAAVLAVAALVALAPGGRAAWTLLRRSGADRFLILLDVAVLCTLGMLLAGMLTFILHRTIIARRQPALRFRDTLVRSLPLTTIALVVLSLLVIGRTGAVSSAGDARPGGSFDHSDRLGGLWGFIDRRNPPVVAGEDQRDEEEEAGSIDTDPDAGSPYLFVLVAVIAALVAAGAAWQWRTRHSTLEHLDGDDPDEVDPSQQAVRGAVIDTIDAMLADPDPKTAIIGAYARLLEGLAASGAGRRRHEAPMEHVHRVLSTLQVRPAPLRQLIQLFELARFSTHLLAAPHRDQALDALRAVAADLAMAHPASATAGQPSIAGPQQ